jgi:hypothetical protein
MIGFCAGVFSIKYGDERSVADGYLNVESELSM